MSKDKTKAYQAAYRASHREERRAYYAAYLVANLDRIRARNAAYRAKNRKEICAKNAIYYASNCENLKEYSANHSAEYYANNRKKILARSAAYSMANKDKLKSYRSNNRDKTRAYEHRWRAANPHKITAKAAKRYASKLNATPVWADQEAIQNMYLEAEYHGMHVDHIVPLLGKNVCGLHVEHNLQLLTKSQNSAKGNRWIDGVIGELK